MWFEGFGWLSHCEPLVPNINQVMSRIHASVGYSKQVVLDQLVIVSEAGIICFPCPGLCVPTHPSHQLHGAVQGESYIQKLHGNVTSCI